MSGTLEKWADLDARDAAEAEARAKWAAAFVAAQAEFPKIPHNQKANAGQFSYAYADLPSIIAHVRPVLAKHGLGFGQSVEPGANGIAVTTRIYHSAGHVESFGPLVLPAGNNAQAAGSAISYARRYALAAALGIAPDEDDDAQTTKADEPKPPKKTAPRKEPEPSTPPGGSGSSPREQTTQTTQPYCKGKHDWPTSPNDRGFYICIKCGKATKDTS